MQNAICGIMTMGGHEYPCLGSFPKNRCKKLCDEKQVFTL
jgi:hypothetical protein